MKTMRSIAVQAPLRAMAARTLPIVAGVRDIVGHDDMAGRGEALRGTRALPTHRGRNRMTQAAARDARATNRRRLTARSSTEATPLPDVTLAHRTMPASLAEAGLL